MKYTQEQLEGMNKSPLNLIITEIKYGKIGSKQHIDSVFPHGNIDYCNDWKACGELLDELIDNGVNLIINSGGVATSNLGKKFNGKSLDVDHHNIKAAIAIVYILVKQESL